MKYEIMKKKLLKIGMRSWKQKNVISGSAYVLKSDFMVVKIVLALYQ